MLKKWVCKLINVQYSVIIMYKERRSYNAGNKTNYSTNQIDKAIFEAEREVAEGAELLDAREALGELRRKHFG